MYPTTLTNFAVGIWYFKLKAARSIESVQNTRFRANRAGALILMNGSVRGLNAG